MQMLLLTKQDCTASDSTDQNNYYASGHSRLYEEAHLNDTLRAFWELESLGIAESVHQGQCRIIMMRLQNQPDHRLFTGLAAGKTPR